MKNKRIFKKMSTEQSSDIEGIPTEPFEFTIEGKNPTEVPFPNKECEDIILDAKLLENRSQKQISVYFEYSDIEKDKPVTKKEKFFDFDKDEIQKQVELIIFPAMNPKFYINEDAKIQLSGQIGPEGCFSPAEEEEEEEEESQ